MRWPVVGSVQVSQWPPTCAEGQCIDVREGGVGYVGDIADWQRGSCVVCFTVLGGTARAHRTPARKRAGFPGTNIEKGSRLRCDSSGSSMLRRMCRAMETRWWCRFPCIAGAAAGHACTYVYGTGGYPVAATATGGNRALLHVPTWVTAPKEACPAKPCCSCGTRGTPGTGPRLQECVARGQRLPALMLASGHTTSHRCGLRGLKGLRGAPQA